MDRKCYVRLSEILELVYCANDYGHGNEVLMSSLAQITGWVSDDEIAEYAASFLTDEAKEQGYTGEDSEEAVKALMEWRRIYCKQP